MEKATLYALEKLYFTKIQRYKIWKRYISEKTIVFRFKKVSFCRNSTLNGLKTLDNG